MPAHKIKELLFYISITEEYYDYTRYVQHDGELTDDFFAAKHFRSFDDAQKAALGYKSYNRRVTVKSLYIENNMFDLGSEV